MNSSEENKAYLDGIRDAQAMAYTKSMQDAKNRMDEALKPLAELYDKAFEADQKMRIRNAERFDFYTSTKGWSHENL